MKYEDLSRWIENEGARYAIVQENNERETFVKIPYDEDFDFIYHQRGYHENNLSRNQAFYYCGLYNKLDGMVYDLQDPLDGHLTEIDAGKDIHMVGDEFKSAVCELIERIVDNNIENLRSLFFEDEKYQHRLDQFKEYYAENTVRQLFLDGKTSEDVKFNCEYSVGRFEEAQMIRYLKYPTATVEEAATQYWQTHQDDMLLDMYMNEHIKDGLEKFEAKEDSIYHRQRNIIEAINKSGAKTVGITIQREDETFSFRYPAFNLGSNTFAEYNVWDIPQKDRENLKNMFEEGSRFYPQEITAITFRGKTIYEAEPFGINEDLDDDEDYGNDMEMSL